MKPFPVAIAVSDLHLSLKPPIARSVEEHWLEVQARRLSRLRKLRRELDVPILCAGDVFDVWNAPAELVNWALDLLPKMYAIPGQHDLPNHSYSEMHRSAYWTLVKAGKLTHMNQEELIVPPKGPTLRVQSFPWNKEIYPCSFPKGVDTELQILVAHRYLWKKDKGYPGADATKAVESKAMREVLKHYDCAIFGDNHQQFKARVGRCYVLNHGTFIRRKSDERRLPGPSSDAVIMSDGSIEMVFTKDAETEQWLPEAQAVKGEESEKIDLTAVFAEMGCLSNDAVDFKRTISQLISEPKVAQKFGQLTIRILQEILSSDI